MRFLSFSSGSCGNCYLLLHEEEGCATSGVLIDAGVSIRRMKKVLESQSLDLDCFQSVLVTHDHGDHIRNLGSICKRLSKPVYTTSMVAEGIEVQYFEVPHDATQTVGYAIRCEGRLFVLMTDLGHVTDEALEWARKADTVVVESNFDVDMLLGGSYPHYLKMRICQGAGHLSNDACGDAIRAFMHPGLRNLFLCHLSGNNNTPRLAYDNARAVLEELGVAPGTVHLRVLERGIPSPLLLL